jgi:hypothetical protein
LVKKSEPKKAESVTRIEKGMKKLFLIRAEEGCSDFTVTQNFIGLKRRFVIPFRKKLKFIRKQI